MDLEKIKRLAEFTQALKGASFEAEKEYNDVYKVFIRGLKSLSEVKAKQLATDLNEVVAPVLKRYEKELRVQLALCAKITD